MIHLKKKHYNRRDFMRMSALASIGFATPFTSISRLKRINSVLPTPPFSDYKAIVCLFLLGGNDSYNMVMPKSGQAYTDYQATRSNLALDSSQMLGIEGDNYGLHPALSDVHALYQSNELALICNTGSLVEPVTKQEYLDGTVTLPLGLFSHLDQYNHWQTASPASRINHGWAGRIADMIGNQNGNQTIPMNVSLSGSNILQYGLNSSEFSMDEYGPVMPTYWDATWGNNEERNAGLDSLVHQSYSDMFMGTYTNIFKNAIEGGQEFESALDAAGDLTTEFSSHYLSQKFKMIARSINIQNDLDFQRQVYYVIYGGWDHHDELLSNHNNYLGAVNNAMAEFNAALKEIGKFNDVTTFVASEFGRKLTSNGNGTDHAWAGNMMVMGGDVNGGNMYGNYPSLALDSNPQLVHDGTLLPDTAADSMFAEIAMWYGIEPSELPTLFPNIGNFHTVADLSISNPPLGFMKLS